MAIVSARKTRRTALRGSAGWGSLIFSLLLLAVLLVGVAWIQGRYQLTRERIPREKAFQLGNLPSGDFGKVFTFGYDTFVAHMLWLRSIQAFGGIFHSSRDYKPILHLFDVITSLEPKMLDAYDFGSMVIAEEARDSEAALKFLDKGMYANPRRYYKIPYDALFQCAFNSDDYKRAKFYHRMAVKCHDAPEWVKSIGYYLDEKMGMYKVAFEKWCRDWFAAVDEGNEFMQEMRRKRSYLSLEKWILSQLNNKIEQFKKDKGRGLKNLQELKDQGYLDDFQYVSWERLNHLIKLAEQNGESLSDNYSRIIRACMVRGDFPEAMDDKERGISLNPVTGEAVKTKDLRRIMVAWLKKIRTGLKEYMEKYDEYPARLTDLSQFLDENGEFQYKEPFTGEWTYDPDTGLLRSESLPDL